MTIFGAHDKLVKLREYLLSNDPADIVEYLDQRTNARTMRLWGGVPLGIPNEKVLQPAQYSLLQG